MGGGRFFQNVKNVRFRENPCRGFQGLLREEKQREALLFSVSRGSPGRNFEARLSRSPRRGARAGRVSVRKLEARARALGLRGAGTGLLLRRGRAGPAGGPRAGARKRPFSAGAGGGGQRRGSWGGSGRGRRREGRVSWACGGARGAARPPRPRREGLFPAAPTGNTGKRRGGRGRCGASLARGSLPGDAALPSPWRPQLPQRRPPRGLGGGPIGQTRRGPALHLRSGPAG